MQNVNVHLAEVLNNLLSLIDLIKIEFKRVKMFKNIL